MSLPVLKAESVFHVTNGSFNEPSLLVGTSTRDQDPLLLSAGTTSGTSHKETGRGGVTAVRCPLGMLLTLQLSELSGL